MGLLLCRLVMIDSVILLRFPDQVDKAKWDETGQQVTERRDLSRYTTLSGATGATATPKAKATSRKSKRPVKQQHRIATTRAQRLANSRCAAEKRLVRRTRTRGPKRRPQHLQSARGLVRSGVRRTASNLTAPDFSLRSLPCQSAVVQHVAQASEAQSK